MIKLMLLNLVSLCLTLNSTFAVEGAVKPTLPHPAPTQYSSVVRTSDSTPNELGLGLLVGEPTGVSGKMSLDHEHALDAGVAYSFQSFFLVFSDYLWTFDSTFLEQTDFTRRLTFYFGAGGGLKFSVKSDVERRANHDDAAEVFLRVPVGSEWRPTDLPVGVFLEFSPGLKVIPGISGMFFGDAGIRYYF